MMLRSNPADLGKPATAASSSTYRHFKGDDIVMTNPSVSASDNKTASAQASSTLAGDINTRAFSTAAIHGGYDTAGNAEACNVPIYATAAFDMHTAEHGDDLASGAVQGFSYSRVANPTTAVLERRLAELEGGAEAVAVGSGMAAVSYALLCAAEDGGRIIAPTSLYGASVDAMLSFFPQFGIHTDFVDDINNLDAVEALITPQTRAIFAESVANPSTEVADVPALAALAHRHGVALIIDNTVPTPYLYRPIEHGADIVVHSTTKGITGHGNAIGGVVIDAGRFDWSQGRYPQFTMVEQAISDERNGEFHSFWDKFGSLAFIRRIRVKYLRTLGAVPSPFNSYLQLVGLETLATRERQEVASATAIARHLSQHPRIEHVNYAGLGNTAQASLVARDFPDGVGTILSFSPQGDESRVLRIIDAVRVFSYVPNIGDSRSLIVNPARITHREVPARYLQAAGVDDQLIRLSIGLEDVSDLIADLDQAIERAYRD